MMNDSGFGGKFEGWISESWFSLGGTFFRCFEGAGVPGVPGVDFMWKRVAIPVQAAMPIIRRGRTRRLVAVLVFT